MMKIRKKSLLAKRLIITGIILLILLVSVNFFATAYVRRTLEKYLLEKIGKSEAAPFKAIRVNFFTGSLGIRGLNLHSADSENDSSKSFDFVANSLVISGINFCSLLFRKKIELK